MPNGGTDLCPALGQVLFRGALRTPWAAGPVTAQTQHRTLGTPAEGGLCIWSHEWPCRTLNSGRGRAGEAALVFQTAQGWMCVWREGQTYGAVRDDPQGWLSQQSNFIILTLPQVSDTYRVYNTTTEQQEKNKQTPGNTPVLCAEIKKNTAGKRKYHHPPKPVLHKEVLGQTTNAETKGKSVQKAWQSPEALAGKGRVCTDLNLPVRTCSALIPHCCAPPTSLTMSSPIMTACQGRETQPKFIPAICHPPLPQPTAWFGVWCCHWIN